MQISFLCIGMQLSTQQINKIKRYFTGLPINRAYLFGSYSRNEADSSSDVDILVELDHDKPIGLRFFVFQDELTILNRKVDLVSAEGLSPYLKPIIDKDKKLIYERFVRR